MELELAARIVVKYYESNPDHEPFIVRSVRGGGPSVTIGAESLREAYASGTLPADIREKLDAVDGWLWDYSETLWLEAEPVLAELIATTGTCVPAKGTRGQRLQASPRMIWAKAHELRKLGRLSDDVAAKFSALPGWEWGPSAEDFDAFIERYPHLHAARRLDELDERYSNKIPFRYLVTLRNDLSPERVAALEALPCWAWDLDVILAKTVQEEIRDLESRTTRYDAAMAVYRAWADSGRDGDAPELPDEPGLRYVARSWLKDNGGREALDAILAEHEWREHGAQLPEVSGEDMDAFTTVIAFLAANGHSWISYRNGVDYDADFTVRRWRDHPRMVHPMIRSTLDATPGWLWDKAEARFESGRPFMDRFVQRTGKSIVPLDHVEDGFQLSQWVMLYVNESRMQPQVEKYLTSLPGWEPRADHYEDAAALIAWQSFFDEYGHAGITYVCGDPCPTLSDKVTRWTNGGRTHHDDPVFSDETDALPDFPFGLRARQAREWMELTAIARTLHIFRAREGADAKLPDDHVEALFPLGSSAYRLVMWCRIALNRGLNRGLREDLVGLHAELEEVVAGLFKDGAYYG